MYECFPKVLVCPSRGKFYVGKKALDVEQLAAPRKKIPPETAETPGLIESRIDGEFEGWEGETIFKLQNGQIWQQVSYAYAYHYAYAPEVLIYRSGSIYKMRVDGVDGSIAVVRLK